MPAQQHCVGVTAPQSHCAMSAENGIVRHSLSLLQGTSRRCSAAFQSWQQNGDVIEEDGVAAE